MEPSLFLRRIDYLPASPNVPREVAVSKILHIHHLVILRTVRNRVNGTRQQGAKAFARGDSSVMLSLLSRKLGAVNFSNFSDNRIDVKSGYDQIGA